MLTSLPPLRLPCTYAQTARNRLPAQPYSSQCHRLFLFLLLLLRSHTIPPPPPPIGRSVALPRWWKRRIYSPRTEVGKREDRPAAARRRGQKSANEAEAETRNCFYSGSGFWAGGGLKKKGFIRLWPGAGGGGDSGPVLVVFFFAAPNYRVFRGAVMKDLFDCGTDSRLGSYFLPLLNRRCR